MPLPKEQKMRLTRRKNMKDYYAEYLVSKSINKEDFEAKEEAEQLRELESFFAEKGYKLERATKGEKSVKSDFEYEALVEKIVDSELTDAQKVAKIKNLKRIKTLNKSIQDAEEKLEKLKTDKKQLEDEIYSL